MKKEKKPEETKTQMLQVKKWKKKNGKFNLKLREKIWLLPRGKMGGRDVLGGYFFANPRKEKWQ